MSDNVSSHDNLPLVARFTSAQADACKILYLNKKTGTDGSHRGWSCGMMDDNGKRYDVILGDVSASADKATVKAAIKEWLLSIPKSVPLKTTGTVVASLLSQDSDGKDIPESLG